MKNFQKITEWQQRHNVSVSQLATKLRVSPDTIYRAKRGESISKVLAWKISMITDINLSELLFPNLSTLIEENKDILEFKTIR